MKWLCETSRCVRRFALFPKKIYDNKQYKTWLVWLEVYYIFQHRSDGRDPWRDGVLANKQIWKEWNRRADHV